MDQAQARDFSVSLSNQISTNYPQGTRQHVNISQSQDSIFNLSHSRPQSRQQPEVSHESNRQDLTSNIPHNILHKNVSSSFSTYLPENFLHLHSTRHDLSQSLSKQAEMTVQTSQRQLEYSHQNSPIDSLRQTSDYSPSHTAHRKQHFSSTQSQQQHKILQSQTETERQTDRREFSKVNFGEESQKPVELFYEHEIKKDSEIKLTNSDIQYLANTENQSSVYSGDGNKQSHTTSRSSPSETEVTQSVELKAKSQILQLQSDRAHVCLTCFKTFKNKPQLTQHELVHNGVRKHVCMYCDKAFKQICHLNQHTRVHTGERPYKCTIEGCGRAFAQLSNLNHHMKNHEEHVRRDISKQYRCDVCDRSYANQNSLHTHIQKLHMNLKAAEGTTSNPITLGSPSKKRKKKNKQQASVMADEASLAQEAAQHYMLQFSDSDEDGLSTQVRSKSESELKVNAMNKMTTVQPVDKKHTGQKLSLPASLGQVHGLPFSEKLPNLQQFTQIKSEHGPARSLDQTGHSKDNGEMQLSQTYSPGHTPPTTTTKAENLNRDIQQAVHRDITRAVNNTPTSANGSPASNVPLPFLIHPNPNITNPPISSTLFSQLPPLSLSQSVADSLPSHIRHHFPDVLTGSHLERDSRNAMAQNFFHPAFSEPSSKAEQNRFR